MPDHQPIAHELESRQPHQLRAACESAEVQSLREHSRRLGVGRQVDDLAKEHDHRQFLSVVRQPYLFQHRPRVFFYCRKRIYVALQSHVGLPPG